MQDGDGLWWWNAVQEAVRRSHLELKVHTRTEIVVEQRRFGMSLHFMYKYKCCRQLTMIIFLVIGVRLAATLKETLFELHRKCEVSTRERPIVLENNHIVKSLPDMLSCDCISIATD